VGTKPRLAESATELYSKIASATDQGVVTGRGILYPAVRIPAVGVFWVRSSTIERVSEDGFTAQSAPPADIHRVLQAIRRDEARVVVRTHWGGSGRIGFNASRDLYDLHSPSGLSFRPLNFTLGAHAETRDPFGQLGQWLTARVPENMRLDEFPKRRARAMSVLTGAHFTATRRALSLLRSAGVSSSHAAYVAVVSALEYLGDPHAPGPGSLEYARVVLLVGEAIDALEEVRCPGTNGQGRLEEFQSI